jgi:hypothetical protein
MQNRVYMTDRPQHRGREIVADVLFATKSKKWWNISVQVSIYHTDLEEKKGTLLVWHL